MTYLAHLVVYFEIYLIVALSLNLIVGYCGMLTLAHAAYYAIGGYVYALLAIRLGWPFFPALLAGAAAAALLSLAVSLPAWRLTGDFFILSSLAVQALLFSLIYNWFDPSTPVGTLTNLTNGPFGIPDIPKPVILNVTIVDASQFFWLVSGVTALSLFVFWRLDRSPWRRALVALREDEVAARGLGKNTRFLKVQVIAISSALAAVAGGVYAGYVGYLDPSSASLDQSILFLSMVLVGGVGNFRGPIVGALILVALPEILRFLDLPDAQAANLRLAIYGALLICMMHFRPQGVAGEYRLT